LQWCAVCEAKSQYGRYGSCLRQQRMSPSGVTLFMLSNAQFNSLVSRYC
jgi:hypothetical protein